MKKSIARLSIAISSVFLLAACQNSDEDKTIDSSSVNELGSKKILSNAMTVEEIQSYSAGEYFLAPLSKFSKLGMLNTDNESEITDDGANYIAVENIFETELKTMQLSFYYNSDDSRDKFNKIFGLWRSSYTSYMDFDVDYANAFIKSNLYDTARNACEVGFDDVKDNLYRGILANASTVYDSTKNLCIVKENGTDIGAFNIWNRKSGIDGDFHYLSKPSGSILVFAKNSDGEYVADDNGIIVSMSVLEDGSYEYVDSNNFINTYDKSGKLVKIAKEGQETIISYDDKEKITRVDGPLESSLVYNYAENEVLNSISYDKKEILFKYNESNQLFSMDMLTNFDSNETNITSISKNFSTYTYNSKGLLETTNREEHVLEYDEDNGTAEVVPANSTVYSYDELNRVVNINSTAGESMIVEYQPTKVTRTIDVDNIIEHALVYKNSKQQITNMGDGSSLLSSEYNSNAQLINVELTEAADVDVNGSIIAQGLEDGKKKLKMSFSYNTRGMINKIQYSSESSGKTFTELEYKSRYTKPTKVLTDDVVAFFEYNQKGQLIKKTSMKFNKEMKLKANSLTLDDVQNSSDRREKSFTYDENGFLSEVTDEVTDETASFHVDNNGKTMKGKKSFIVSQATKVVPVLNVSDATVQSVFVGGLGDHDTIWGASNIVYNYSNLFYANQNNTSYYTWDDIDTFIGLPDKTDPFKKTKTSLVVIGHSYGGDSSVEASKQTSTDKKVNLLITVDPVGIWDWNDGADYWVEIYAKSGRAFGGYYSWQRKCYTKKIRKWRRTWRFRICYPALNWNKRLKWNGSDYLAFVGGKGWYSSYDPGDASPDKLFNISAHHEDFAYMLWKMEKDNPAYNFSISDTTGYPITPGSEDNNMLTKEASYGKVPMSYSNVDTAAAIAAGWFLF